MKNAPATGFLSAVDLRLEARHEIRLTAKGRTFYQLEDGEPLVLLDVSSGGCQTRTGKFAPPQRVIIDLPILGERRVQVCWVKGRRIGCRFTEPLTRDELSKIRAAGCAKAEDPDHGVALV